MIRNKSLKTGRPYKLRCIEVKDDYSKMTCKLWSEHAELEPEPDTEYTFKCVEVDRNDDYPTTIQTTDLTQIERATGNTIEKETMINIIGLNTK